GKVIAKAAGYDSAFVTVTLTVSVQPALSFSPTTLSFSVVQGGTTANKSSTLSANTVTPTVTLTKSASWLVLPAAALGSLSIGINSSGLAVGTYTGKVVAKAAGYDSAFVTVILTVTARALSFSPTSISYSVVQGGVSATKTSSLSANTGTPTI